MKVLPSHSWFFRNALVRAHYENIPKGIHRTFEPLERFMNFAVFGIPADLRNRTLHIRWKEVSAQSDNKSTASTPLQSAIDEVSKGQNVTLNVTLEEMAVLKCIKSNPKVTQKAIAEVIGKSDRTIKRIIAVLTEKGILLRRNGRRNGWWEIVANQKG